MKTKELNNKTIREFESISDLMNFIRNTERTDFFKGFHLSDKISDERSNFSGTESIEEAEDLLIHGWDEEAKKIEKMLKRTKKITSAVGYKNKMVYGMQGFQACVPRYLQGMPDSMIRNKRIVTKQKVVTINKSISYACRIKKEQIEKESLKVFRCVNKLEQQGLRVNLNICLFIDGNCFIIKIKQASQRMNIKQTAFPMVHPSMLRRIGLALIERAEETKNVGYGYGSPRENRTILKGSYFFPAIIDEENIENINKYKVD